MANYGSYGTADKIVCGEDIINYLDTSNGPGFAATSGGYVTGMTITQVYYSGALDPSLGSNADSPLAVQGINGLGGYPQIFVGRTPFEFVIDWFSGNTTNVNNMCFVGYCEVCDNPDRGLDKTTGSWMGNDYTQYTKLGVGGVNS